MNTNQLVLLAAGGALLYTAATKINAANSFGFYLKGFPKITFEGFTPILHLDLVIQNPSNQTFTARSAVGTLYVNQNLVGNISSFQTVQINPVSETKFPLTIRLVLSGIIQDFIDTISGGSGISQVLEIQGNMNIDKFLIPLKLKYRVI